MKTAAKLSSELLEQRKAAVLRKWQNLVFDTYAPDTAAILKSGGDRFANPVSYNISNNLELILDGLTDGRPEETLFPYLEEIIRIRAVQELTPETAVCFMSLLKTAFIAETGVEADDDLADRIERLSASCPDIYRKCRDRIELIKIREKAKTARYLTRLISLQENEK